MNVEIIAKYKNKKWKVSMLYILKIKYEEK